MINRKQRQEIAQRLTNELSNVSDAETLQIGTFVYTLAAIPTGHDTEFLLNAVDPNTGRKEPVLSAAKICLQELAKNN